MLMLLSSILIICNLLHSTHNINENGDRQDKDEDANEMSNVKCVPSKQVKTKAKETSIKAITTCKTAQVWQRV